MQRKKIVLFEPMYYGQNRMVQSAPLSLLTISGLLDKQGHDIKIISRAFYDDPYQEAIEQCKNADIFGVTALTGYQIKDGLSITRKIKEHYPNIQTVWGGWHPSLDPATTIKEPTIDIVVRGQGERTFYELVNGKPIEDILGITTKTISTPDRPMEDINNFPPIPYHLIDLEKIINNDEFGKRVINYISSYGCPNKCSFCAEHKVHNSKWTALSSERLLADCEMLHKRYNIDCIQINDTQFFLNKKRVMDFCDGLKDRGLNIKWDNVEGNIRQLLSYTNEEWQKMIDCGLSSILVGAESGYYRALKEMNKPLTTWETFQFIQKAKKFNIKILYSFMLGLPWDRIEVENEIEYTFRMARHIIDENRNNRVLLCIYTPYPGNELFDKSVEYGLKPPKSLIEWGEWNLMKKTTDWVTDEQAEHINFTSSYLFFFLDATSYRWITPRVKNIFLRCIFKIVFKLYTLIAMFRWKFDIYCFPIDYKLYLWGRERLGIA